MAERRHLLPKPLPPLLVALLRPLLAPRPQVRARATVPDIQRANEPSADEPSPAVWLHPELPPGRIPATHESAAWLCAVVISNFLRSNPAIARFPGARSLRLRATGKLFCSLQAGP